MTHRDKHRSPAGQHCVEDPRHRLEPELSKLVVPQSRHLGSECLFPRLELDEADSSDNLADVGDTNIRGFAELFVVATKQLSGESLDGDNEDEGSHLWGGRRIFQVTPWYLIRRFGGLTPARLAIPMIRNSRYRQIVIVRGYFGQIICSTAIEGATKEHEARQQKFENASEIGTTFINVTPNNVCNISSSSCPSAASARTSKRLREDLVEEQPPECQMVS